MFVDTSSHAALVSVIIPTYNRPLYLRQALKSAVEQKYQNIEIIVADNCSPESPQVIVESFQDSRINFWRNTQNIGLSKNFINACKRARGKYIASLHDDDLWNEDFLEKLVPHLESNPDLTLAFCDHYIIDTDGNINYPATVSNTHHWKRDQLKEGVYKPFSEIGLVHQAVSTATAAVIRKDAVDWDNIPSEVGCLLDVYITYLCCRSGAGAYYCPEKLTKYREHTQTDTMLCGRDVQIKIRNALARIWCYERLMEDEQLQEFRPYFKQQWVQANTTLGIGLLRAEQVAQARPYFWRSLSQEFSLRTMAALMLSFTPKSLTTIFRHQEFRSSGVQN